MRYDWERISSHIHASPRNFLLTSMDILLQATIAGGAYPAPLHYYDFPKSVCTSINEVVCHGIPDARELKNGDVVNVDVTVRYDRRHELKYIVLLLSPEVCLRNSLMDSRQCGTGDPGWVPWGL